MPTIVVLAALEGYLSLMDVRSAISFYDCYQDDAQASAEFAWLEKLDTKQTSDQRYLVESKRGISSIFLDERGHQRRIAQIFDISAASLIT